MPLPCPVSSPSENSPIALMYVSACRTVAIWSPLTQSLFGLCISFSGFSCISAAKNPLSALSAVCVPQVGKILTYSRSLIHQIREKRSNVNVLFPCVIRENGVPKLPHEAFCRPSRIIAVKRDLPVAKGECNRRFRVTGFNRQSPTVILRLCEN